MLQKLSDNLSFHDENSRDFELLDLQSFLMQYNVIFVAHNSMH